MMRVALVEPPARTSNKHETWTSMPDAEVTVISDRGGWGGGREVVLPAARVPLVGGREGWTLAPAWLRHLDDVARNYDVIVSLELFSFTTAQAARIAKRHGMRHVIHVAETMANNPIYRIPPYRQITRAYGTTADLIVCSTPRAQRHAIALGCPAQRTVVVAPGVDTTMFSPAPSRPSNPLVLFVGALRADRGADKGVGDIVAACERARERVPHLTLRLIGDGPLRAELAATAGRLGFMEVLGSVPRARLPDHYRQASVFALASKRTWKWEEQFGFVLLEAMASGLPIVATRSGAIPDVVPHQNWLVKEGDIDGITAGIVTALGAEHDAVGASNRMVALSGYSITGQAAKLRHALDVL
jgi:phosphatidyl-myo-inositol dimannoside synthase